MCTERRKLRKEYGPKGAKLPPKLAFLKSVRFYAVAKHRLEDGKRQIRIEFLVKPLKEFVELIDRAKEIQDENTSLEAKVKALEKANEQLMANLDECDGVHIHEPRSRMKTYCQAAKERGFKSNGPPLQGGIPGLGKKR